jgi:hypothetical protein
MEKTSEQKSLSTTPIQLPSGAFLQAFTTTAWHKFDDTYFIGRRFSFHLTVYNERRLKLAEKRNPFLVVLYV